MSHLINGTTLFDTDAEAKAQDWSTMADPAVIDQGKMGLSMGGTNLVSVGFSGCMGVIVIPRDGQAGGFLSHVHEGRPIPGRKNEYYREAIGKSIAEARVYLHDHLGIVLYNGEDGGVALLDGLVDYVRALPGVGSLLDLRPQKGTTGSAILWDIINRRIYCVSGVVPFDDIAPQFRHVIALDNRKPDCDDMPCLHWN